MCLEVKVVNFKESLKVNMAPDNYALALVEAMP